MNPPRSRWGIYEKALPTGSSWTELLGSVTAAGYEFLEVSIDESEERLERLHWSAGYRQALHRALNDSEATIDTMCLSAHRRYSLGSASASIREQGLTIVKQAIEFAAEFGLRIVQVAGYDVFYEESTEETRALFLENLFRAAEAAEAACVMLGIENVDRPVMDSITKALGFVKEINSPWFQIYPDIANLAAMGLDVCSELLVGRSHLVGLHLKDSRPGEIRRVPFGEGMVQFPSVFRVLGEIGYRGPFVVEMWNEALGEPVAAASLARRWLMERQ